VTQARARGAAARVEESEMSDRSSALSMRFARQRTRNESGNSAGVDRGGNRARVVL